MGSTDLDCSVDILSLLNQLDLKSEMSLPSPIDSVYTSTLTSLSPMTSGMNGSVLQSTGTSRRRPLLCSAISLPESFHMTSATVVSPQQLLSPEPRFNSAPARLEDMYTAAAQMHQQIGSVTSAEFGAKQHAVSTPACDLSRRAFSIEDAQSFVETLRRSSAAMAYTVPQQHVASSQAAAVAGGGNRKLSSTSSSSFDADTSSSVAQQQQQPVRYKTELCRPYEEHGTCRYGSKCQFAHGRAELRIVVRHPKYKTEMCRTFHTTGYCPYGIRCHFIHETAVTTERQLAAANSNTDVAVENGFCHRLVAKASSSDGDSQTSPQNNVERRRSALMQMHLQQTNSSKHFDDAMSVVGVDRDRKSSVGNYNQPSALPLPMDKASSFETVFPDVLGCSPSYEKLPPPPGLSLPVEIATDAAAFGQRSNGSSPTSELTSGFSSCGSSGDVNSGPGSPATSLTSVGLQFFQQPVASLPSYRAEYGHPTLSAGTSLPIPPNEPSVAASSYVVDQYMENAEVKPLMSSVIAELNLNRAPENVLQLRRQRIASAACDQSTILPGLPDVGGSSTLWTPTDSSTAQLIPRDDLDSLQMMASLKPDELVKLIQLVKLCSVQSTSGSSDLSVDVAANVVATHHHPLQGTGNYGMTMENAWNQAPVTPYSNQHHASMSACW